MPNTYTQITIHAVFAVKYRENFITKDWRVNLHQLYFWYYNQQGSESPGGRWLERPCTHFIWDACYYNVLLIL